MQPSQRVKNEGVGVVMSLAIVRNLVPNVTAKDITELALGIAQDVGQICMTRGEAQVCFCSKMGS